MTFRAIFASIREIRAGFCPPKTARTEQLSIADVDQSIWSADPSSSKRSFHIFFHTPATCQSRSRRQHVMPHPQPNSWGRYSQGQTGAGVKGRTPAGAKYGIVVQTIKYKTATGGRGSARNHRPRVLCRVGNSRKFISSVQDTALPCAASAHVVSSWSARVRTLRACNIAPTAARSSWRLPETVCRPGSSACWQYW